jgi:hypothetical protein
VVPFQNYVWHFRPPTKKVAKFELYKNNDELLKGPGELLPSLGVRRRRTSVVRRKLFKNSSPLKLLDQLKPNLV